MTDSDNWWEQDKVVGTAPVTPPAGALPPSASEEWWKADKPTVTASPTGIAPDKYQQAAIDERNALLAKGVPLGEGYTSRAAHGAGIGWTDEIMAGMTTPLEMIKRGTYDPREAYAYAKARENLNTQKTEENTQGVGGALAGVAGGLATGAGVLGSGTRVAGAVPNYLANVGKAGAFGEVAGFGEGDTLRQRAEHGAMGGLIGMGIGAAAPLVVGGVQQGARLFQLPRLRDPEKVAVEHLEEVVRNSGKTPQQVVQEVSDARAAGQPYTVADALGHEGQRKLTGLAKTPGEQRELITERLMERNLNMPHRVGTQVGEGLGVTTTADAASKALIEKASKTSAPLYAESKALPTWSEKIQTFIDDPIAKGGLRQGVEIQRLRTVGTDKPFNPKDAAITHFNEAGDPVIEGVPNMETLHTLKVGLDRMIENEINPNTNKLNARGQALLTFKNNMLSEIDSLNPKYAEARKLYAGPMEVKDAIREGRDMATRGRYSDNIAAFYGKNPAEQQGVRIGYADKVVEPLEKTGNYPGILRQKSEKGVNELDALSLYQGPNRPGDPSQLRRRLNREETMIETKNKALGGSSTAENLADMANTPGAAFNTAIGIGRDALSHNWLGMAQNAISRLEPLLKGESAAQRLAITKKLLETDPDKIVEMAKRIERQSLLRQGMNPDFAATRHRAPRYPAGQ